jgi:hypothetical protein
MKERSSVAITTLGAAVLFGLIYEFRRQRASATEIRQIHDIAARNLAQTEQVHRILRRTRGAVNDLHQYVMPETKGVKKAAS